jgi:hypothetical protein
MALDFDREGKRYHELDRVNSLAQIARDCAACLDERIDTNFQAIKGITAA